MNRRHKSQSRAKASTLFSSTSTTNVTLSETRTNLELITIVWLDLQSQATPIIIGSIRAINDFVRIYTDTSACMEALKISKDKVFLILSFYKEELILQFHAIDPVEAIFIFDLNISPVEHEYPKLIGFFKQHEELTRSLKYAVDTYQQIQLEVFRFEDENAFLWLQLWKDEVLTSKIPANNRNEFLEIARVYYQNNARRLQYIADFDRTYRPKDALRWCFRSPFPANLLRRAFTCQDFEQLSLCRFLIVETSRIIQQPDKSTGMLLLYRGMKLLKNVVDQFEQRTGQLVCANDFITCTKSRAYALDLATSPGYRTDLVSVLFKIECDSTVKAIETSIQNRPVMSVFDIGTTFRIVCLSRGAIIAIKMKAVAGEGKRIVRDYKEAHRGISIPTLFNRLAQPQEIKVKQTASLKEELQAEEFEKNGQIDLAIGTLEDIKFPSASVLLRLGHLYADKKGDYENAFRYYTQALKMQEKAGEDISDTVTRIGTIHFERREYNSALTCHACALRLRESMDPLNLSAIATNLIGIANAHRANHEFSEALTYAKRALAIREAIVPPDEILVAKTLATLANIYHELKDDSQALQMGVRALDIFQRTLPPNSTEMAGLLNNLGAIKLSQGSISEARQNFERSIHIYRKALSSTHPYLTKLENNIRYVCQLEQGDDTQKSLSNEAETI